ncbi:MAG: hypothetical protein K6B44_12620 [Lachnospiraceae bacterium]|nr:hypothetical protein [Lachnospiraceae bacterium]
MQVQMTQRDKKLIVMLVLLVTVVGFGWWGIRPAIRDHREMSAELEEQELLEQLNKTKLAKMAMYEAEAQSYREESEELKKNFFPIMTSSEVDRYFTEMILDHGLSAYDLTMKTGAKPVPVEPYQYSELAAIVAQENERLKNETPMTDTADMDPFEYTGSPAYNSEIYGVDVTLRLAGDMYALRELIEDISSSEQLLLVRNCIWSEQISMVNEGDTEDEEFVPVMRSTTVLNVNLTLYMCDQSNDTIEE